MSISSKVPPHQLFDHSPFDVRLPRMKIVNLLLSRKTIGVLVTLAALIAFNATRSNLKTEALASFTTWQTSVSAILANPNADASTPKVVISVRIENPAPGTAAQSWSLPKVSITDPTDRSQVFRVLQLLSESKIFGMAPQAPSETPTPTLRVSVSDETNRFETTVPLSVVDQNIQLQNLLKLLEIFSAAPREQVNPSQL